MRWTTEQLVNHPNFGKLVLKNDSKTNDTRLRAKPAKSDERLSLHGGGGSEEARWHPPGCSFEIVFTIYSVRPADYDGYDIKALQDFLVKAGIITDDRWDILAGRVVSKKAATQGEEKTEIEITVKEAN